MEFPIIDTMHLEMEENHGLVVLTEKTVLIDK